MEREFLFETYISEGANIEYTKIFADHFEKYTEYRKEANKAAKEKDYKTAIYKYTEAKKNAVKIESDFAKINEDNFSSAVIGILLSNLIGALSIPLIIIGPKQAGVGTAEELILFVKQLKSDHVSNYKAFNGYRNKLILAAREMARLCTFNIQSCKEAIEKQK